MVYLHIAVAPFCRNALFSEGNFTSVIPIVLDWCDNTGTGIDGDFALQKKQIGR